MFVNAIFHCPTTFFLKNTTLYGQNSRNPRQIQSENFFLENTTNKKQNYQPCNYLKNCLARVKYKCRNMARSTK